MVNNRMESPELQQVVKNSRDPLTVRAVIKYFGEQLAEMVWEKGNEKFSLKL